VSDIGYARVSTKEQNLQLQLDALEKAGCTRRDIYADDGVSGKFASRPQLDACLEALQPGDTLNVWKLDRLGRSLQHLITVVNELKDRGVNFRSFTEGIDTSTPGGKLYFHMIGALAEFERDLIIERTMAGLQVARDRGYVGGNQPKLTGEQVRIMRQMLTSGFTISAVARNYGVSRTTIYRVIEATDAELRERDARTAARRKWLSGGRP
jgi:DNA invertase Pin-like site-specific DNA recombinase